MATIKTDLICNLNQPVNVTYLHGNLFSQDNAGNTINVFVMDNGEPATIGGTVSANVIRSDGQTVAVSGAIEGNKAYVVLPQACYAVSGVVHIIIKLTQNTTITTIAAIVANVYMSTTDAVIDPGTVIPSIQALMALIEEAVDSIPTDYTGLLHTIAADYSSSKTYKVGDYAWESGVLKRCIVPITAAETYTAAHWTNAVIGDDLTNLKSALSFDEFLINAGEYTIQKSDLESGQWSYSTKAENSARARTKNLLPVRAGMTITYTNSTYDIYLGVLATPTSGSYAQTIGWLTASSGAINITKDGYLTFIIRNHSNTSAVIDVTSESFVFDSVVTIATDMDANKTLKKYTPSGATFSVWDMPQASYYNGFPTVFGGSIDIGSSLSSTATYQVLKVLNRVYISAPNRGEFYIGQKSNNNTQYWSKVDIGTEGFPNRGKVATNTDLDTIKDSGIWFLDSSYTYTHHPFTGHGGILLVFKYSNNTIMQIAEQADTGILLSRCSLLGTFPSTWGINGTVNNYYFQDYENSYTINCSPTITTDTNNYLASTEDDTDRTGDIQTMLNTTGVCHLGAGRFVVTGIEVPNYASLIGSGERTVLVLDSSVETGYAVKLKTNSSISDMRISGGTAPTLSATVGTRHGIVFEGTKVPNSSSGTTYERSRIDRCHILNFSGGGITCNATGGSPISNLLISDCFVNACNVGMNIPYFSEFHRIANCSFTENWYGCINNGGNNNFSNCDFSRNRIGILIDNSTDQSYNNSHGTYSGCTFNHSFSDAGVANKGTAIKLLGVTAGEVFTGSQIFFGAIVMDDCVGVRFIGANVGRMCPITITDSTVVTFSDCTFREGAESTDSPFTQSGNTTLKFTDCYLRDGTVYDPMN